MDQASGLRSMIDAEDNKNRENAKVLTVTSGKGGVGKSNTAVNLAVWFRKFGKRVIILDADFGLANVGVMFDTISKYTLKDMIFEGKDIRDIITKGPMDIGFISGGSGISELNDLRRDQVSYLVNSLSVLNELCDILIIDTGAGVSDAVMQFVLTSPEVLLITTPEPASLTDSYSLVKALYKNPRFEGSGVNVRLIANKVNSKDEALAVYNKLNSVVRKFLGGEIDYLGMIPQDPLLEKAVRSQRVVTEAYPNAKSVRAYEGIARELLGDTNDSKRYGWGISQILNRLIYT
ncbi:MAG: MinD/ParA family protein [Lachnospiraceae bacterium]|nr:MinD/ParA family protein [Lachnospiraceae bacterium]